MMIVIVKVVCNHGCCCYCCNRYQLLF